MKNETYRQIEALARHQAFPCVTITLPAAGEGRASHQDSVRLRNSLRRARTLLEGAGASSEVIDALLRPMAERLDDARFWAMPEGGVSLHAAPGRFDVVRTDVDRARELVVAQVRGAVARQVGRWLELRSGGRAIDELESIVRAAAAGEIEVLFVTTEMERWGTWEADLCHVALHVDPERGDVDLLDFAAAQTLVQGGEVHALPPGSLPEGRGVAAILRFAKPEQDGNAEPPSRSAGRLVRGSTAAQ
jgi:hypothetical protein